MSQIQQHTYIQQCNTIVYSFHALPTYFFLILYLEVNWGTYIISVANPRLAVESLIWVNIAQVKRGVRATCSVSPDVKWTTLFAKRKSSVFCSSNDVQKNSRCWYFEKRKLCACFIIETSKTPPPTVGRLTLNAVHER